MQIADYEKGSSFENIFMSSFKNWLVVADMTPGDYHLLSNVRFFADKLHPETLHIIHVTPKLDLPSSVLKEIADLNKPLLEGVQNRLEEMCKKTFGQDFKWKLTVKEGNALAEIVKFSTSKHVDLILMNLKDETAGQELSHKKIARKSFVSALFLPERPIRTLSHTLLPVDFSASSKKGQKFLDHWATRLGVEKVTCQHVYKNADWYMDRLFYSAQEVEQNLEQRKLLENKLYDYAAYKLSKFVQGFKQLDAREVKTLASKANKGIPIWQLVYKDIKKLNPDFITIGARGESRSPLVLLGSVTEKIIKAGLDIPILVYRDKKMPSRFLKLLTRL